MERAAENRQKVATEVARAIRRTFLTRRTQTLIEMVAKGEKTSQQVGTEVVRVLSRSRLLYPLDSVPGDLGAPGWKETEQGNRIVSYRVREPGWIDSPEADLGGDLTLSAAQRKTGLSYIFWELRWTPQGFTSVDNISPAALPAESSQPETSMVAELQHDEVLHVKTSLRGRILRGPDGKVLTDPDGKIKAEIFDHPPFTASIPEALIGTTYKIGPID